MKKGNLLEITAAVVVTLASLASPLSGYGKYNRPNIAFFFGDDVGT